MRQSALRANSVVPLAPNSAVVGQVGDPGLTFGRALRRPGVRPISRTVSATSRTSSAAAPAMLDHALKEVGALLLPVDAGKGLRQRGEHGVLDAIGPRGR